jgi:uncharacterized protein involved in exopolysaccharide biosynthesis
MRQVVKVRGAERLNTVDRLDPGDPHGTGEGQLVGLFESAWRHRLVLAIVVVVAATCGYLISSFQPAVYQAQATLLYSGTTSAPFGDSAIPGQGQDRYLATEADRVTSKAVATAAAAASVPAVPVVWKTW